MALLVALALVSTAAVVTRGGDSAPKQSLSDRINVACPKGYNVTDWETDSEFSNLPDETVKVTCSAADPNHIPSTVYRSVAR